MSVLLGHTGGCLSLLGPSFVTVTLSVFSVGFAQTPHAEGHPVPLDLSHHFIIMYKISYAEISNYAAYSGCFFGPRVLTSFLALFYCKTKDSLLPWYFYVSSLCSLSP